MKKLNYLITLSAVAAAIYTANAARADEPLLSPRAKSNQIHILKGSGTQDPNLLTGLPTGNAKGWAVLQSVRTVSNTGADIDLAHNRPTLSPKDPRYETALREMATQQFQVAPVK
jgi:hypothetical protein